MRTQLEIAPQSLVRQDRGSHAGGIGAPSRSLLRLLREPRALLGLVAAVAALASILAGAGGPQALLYDNLQELVAALGGAVVLVLASQRGEPDARRLRRALALALAATAAGMVAWDFAPLSGGTLGHVGDLLLVLSTGLAVITVIPALFGELGAERLGDLVTDTLMLALAGITIVATVWELGGGPGDPLAPLGVVFLAAALDASAFALLSRRIVPAPRGPWVVLSGGATLGVAWLMWIGDVAAPVTVGPSDFLFSMGLLLLAYGALDWDLRPTGGVRFERTVEILRPLLPVMAIVLTVGLTAYTDGPELFDLVGVTTGAVVIIAALRQVYLYARMARAREAERLAGERLAEELRERAATLLSLQRLVPADTPEATARAICTEALHVDSVDLALVRAYPAEGGVAPLAAAGLGQRGIALERSLGAAAARQARSRAAHGSWVWSTETTDDAVHSARLRALGVHTMVWAPLRRDEQIIGDIGLGTREAQRGAVLADHRAMVEEFAMVTAGLLGPALAERDRRAALRRETVARLTARAFYPVFQPIVDLESRTVVGYEALTRFTDGERPDRCFAQAREAGLGPEFELATLAAAVSAAQRLPAGAWLDLNVSPALLLDWMRLRAVVGGLDRPVVVEITEHEPVADYGALREAFGKCPHELRLAVDDAGAGAANFGHIVELRPDFIKLDISLVRHVDTDLGRQALVVAMRHFSKRAGCRLVAEGIETEAEARTLVDLGIELGQGYLLGRPASIEDLLAALPD